MVTGQAGQALVAFTSADGASWRRTAAFGSAAARDVSGVAMAEGGTVVTAGTTTDDPDSRQPLLTVLGPQARPQDVDVNKIPGATDPELAVNDIAAGNGMQVAVGSADGYPAAWTSTNGGGSWTRASGQTQAVLDRPGVQQLTSVTFGADGWLAVGGVIAVAAQHPVVLGSGNGSVWIAADREAAFSQPGLFTEQAAAGPGGYVIVGYQAVGGRTIAAAWWSAGLTGWQRAGTPAGAGAADAGRHRGPARVRRGRRGRRRACGLDLHRTAAAPGPSRTSRCRSAPPGPCSSTSPAAAAPWSRWAPRSPPPASSCRSRRARPTAARTWTESVLPVPAGRAFVTALTALTGAATAAGDTFLATGTFGSTAGHQDVVVWTSASGSSWKAVTPGGQGLTGPGIQAITGLTVSGRTLSGVGFTATPGGEQPVLWQSPVR